ncbi:hypothetical protein [[Scytonema hofmanni] UTEX B 1581]|uniref:hypothetical protein n=1 Tax=[Scytonema hofmanni] UTEX B 1581 TaxID=379535 RepID=UPI0011821CC8|nr:hypothetical protein [[Scytonema hofmanni] UTEX B 1581]
MINFCTVRVFYIHNVPVVLRRSQNDIRITTLFELDILGKTVPNKFVLLLPFIQSKFRCGNPEFNKCD